MNKLLLLFFIATSSVSYASDISSPRNTLITAIARNDYGTVTKTLETYPLTQEDKQEFLEMADQMIINAIKWLSKHHRQPEIGIESFKAIGYGLATVTAAAFTLLSAGIVASTVEGKFNEDKHFRLERLPELQYSIGATAALTGVSWYLFYKTIQKVIAAWTKPSHRLENAMRIKDAILHASAI